MSDVSDVFDVSQCVSCLRFWGMAQISEGSQGCAVLRSVQRQKPA